MLRQNFVLVQEQIQQQEALATAAAAAAAAASTQPSGTRKKPRCRQCGNLRKGHPRGQCPE